MNKYEKDYVDGTTWEKALVQWCNKHNIPCEDHSNDKQAQWDEGWDLLINGEKVDVKGSNTPSTWGTIVAEDKKIKNGVVIDGWLYWSQAKYIYYIDSSDKDRGHLYIIDKDKLKDYAQLNVPLGKPCVEDGQITYNRYVPISDIEDKGPLDYRGIILEQHNIFNDMDKKSLAYNYKL